MSYPCWAGTVTYLNPKTGQYSRLTQREAAITIQRRVRWRQGKAAKLTLPKLVQAVTLQNRVVDAYKYVQQHSRWPPLLVVLPSPPWWCGSFLSLLMDCNALPVAPASQ